MISHKKAHNLTIGAVHWFFNNKSDLSLIDLKVKTSANNPKYTDEVWARLMTEAISSFYDGLDLDPENRRASKTECVCERAINLVGAEAFKTIAFLVSAAGVRRPIEEEVEEAFEGIQAPGEQYGIQTPWQNLPDYIVNDADQQIWGQVSSYLSQMASARQTQVSSQNTAQTLQRLSTTPGVSQEFAQALAGVGAQYQIQADETARESLITRAEKVAAV